MSHFFTICGRQTVWHLRLSLDDNYIILFDKLMITKLYDNLECHTLYVKASISGAWKWLYLYVGANNNLPNFTCCQKLKLNTWVSCISGKIVYTSARKPCLTPSVQDRSHALKYIILCAFYEWIVFIRKLKVNNPCCKLQQN